MDNENRRRFLKKVGATAAGIFAYNVPHGYGETIINPKPQRKLINLRDTWFIRQLSTDSPDISLLEKEILNPGAGWFSAQMPAQVHEILLKNGEIPDPHIGKNAAKCTWVGETNWAYGTVFLSPDGEGPVFIHFEGLDTVAKAYLNGEEIGRFDNMFRSYSCEIRKLLRPPGDTNVLIIIFTSPERYLRELETRFMPQEGIDPLKYFRKCHSDFGSYLGAAPNSMKVGIYRDIILDVPAESWFEDIWVRPRLVNNVSRAEIDVEIRTGGSPCAILWRLESPAGEFIARGETVSGSVKLSISLDNPELWWPRTHGTQGLYSLEFTLPGKGVVRDRKRISFGIRGIEPVLADPETGEKRFGFRVNGTMIFLRGACWAPVEGMTHCWTPDRAERLYEFIEHGNMNILRVWGEGVIPPDEFYDACDRKGIFVWQDFMFGYGIHPDGPPEFDENRRLEIEGMIRRLRNHPCLLLWCGGNENHMGYSFSFSANPAQGNTVHGKIMPDSVRELDPDRLFHPSSPYGGPYPNYPLEGDWHDYSTLNFSPSASVPLFASEVGRVSAPSMASMRRFLLEEDIWPDKHSAAVKIPGKPSWPDMWQYRSVGGSWDKIGPIEEFCEPQSAEELIRVLGTAHGEYLGRRIERERRGVPDGFPDGHRRCWGNTIWRLNDSWPIIYWSAIDYYLEPKIAYYFLRRAYSPILISFEISPDSISLWIVNDSGEPSEGTLVVKKMRFDGTVRGEISKDVNIKPGDSKRCPELGGFGLINLRNEFLYARYNDMEATKLLIGERYLHLPKSNLHVRPIAGGLEITTDGFVRQVTLDAIGAHGAVFEDNFFDMPPESKRVVKILNRAGGKRISARAFNAEGAIVELP